MRRDETKAGWVWLRRKRDDVESIGEERTHNLPLSVCIQSVSYLPLGRGRRFILVAAGLRREVMLPQLLIVVTFIANLLEGKLCAVV